MDFSHKAPKCGTASTEIDLNPLKGTGCDLFAVDARIIVDKELIAVDAYI